MRQDAEDLNFTATRQTDTPASGKASLNRKAARAMSVWAVACRYKKEGGAGKVRRLIFRHPLFEMTDKEIQHHE